MTYESQNSRRELTSSKSARQTNRDRTAKSGCVDPVVELAVELGHLVGRHLADEEKARRADSTQRSKE